MLKSFLATATLAGALVTAAFATVEAAPVRVQGSTTVAGLLEPRKGEVEGAAGVELEIRGVGSSRGIAALVAGEADIAMISAPLDQVVIKMNQKNPGSVDGSLLIAHQVGGTEVAFAVHPSNPVKALTLAQITEILAGRVTDWSQLGGQSGRIDVAVAYKGDGIRTMVEKRLLGGASVSGKPRELRFANQIPQVVAAVPNAFGLTTSSRISTGIIPVRTDDSIAQPLLLVTRGEPGPELQGLIEAVRKALGG